MNALDWSIPLGRYFGIDVRLHWSLALLVLWQVGSSLGHGMPAWWLPILIVIPFVSILLHEFGHSFMARLVGGESSLIVMWMFGGLAMCSYPSSPGRQFAVSAAGPLVTFMIFALCTLTVGQGTSIVGALNFDTPVSMFESIGKFVLSDAAQFNLAILLFNLLPCYPMDGGKMFQAALWPLTGVRRATWITIIASYVCIAGLFVYSAKIGSIFIMLLTLGFLMSTVQLHQATRNDMDPYLGTVPVRGDRRPSWLARWRARRRDALIQRVEREEADEQVILDRLLAKVSEQGLPSLTTQERDTLQRISKKQKQRMADLDRA
jgi:Zn-dependent protease